MTLGSESDGAIRPWQMPPSIYRYDKTRIFVVRELSTAHRQRRDSASILSSIPPQIKRRDELVGGNKDFEFDIILKVSVNKTPSGYHGTIGLATRGVRSAASNRRKINLKFEWMRLDHHRLSALTN